MRQRLSISAVLAVVVCVCCTFALGVTRAKADVDFGLGGNNTMRVQASREDIDVSSSQVEVYLVATGTLDEATGSYVYTFDNAFADLAEIYATGATSANWDTMTEMAWDIVKATKMEPKQPLPKPGENITGLVDGVYLVNMTGVQTTTDSYYFVPALVAVPGRVDAEGKPVYNTSVGRWTNSDPAVPVDVFLKTGIAGRYGSLKINKTVTDFAGEAATFVYHIYDRETEGKVYENYVAVQYTAQGVASKKVGHIPAGLNLIVEEVYTGARYELVSEAKVFATIAGDAVVDADFTNKPKDNGPKGHGIENHFVCDEDPDGNPETNDGDWFLTPELINGDIILEKNPDAA